MEQTRNDAELVAKVEGLADGIARLDTSVGKLEPGIVDLSVRFARVETALDFVRRDVQQLQAASVDLRKELSAVRTTDFRILFGATISVALVLSGLMAKGFGWL